MERKTIFVPGFNFSSTSFPSADGEVSTVVVLSCLERNFKHSFLLVLGPKHPFAPVPVQIVFRDQESF